MAAFGKNFRAGTPGLFTLPSGGPGSVNRPYLRSLARTHNAPNNGSATMSTSSPAGKPI